MPDDDDVTRRLCMSCGGNYELPGTTDLCRWCTSGFMDPVQYKKWLTQKSAPHKLSQSALMAHRSVFFERALRAWEKVPDMSFGELIVEALAFQHMTLDVLRTLDNDRLMQIVERYVLTRSSVK